MASATRTLTKDEILHMIEDLAHRRDDLLGQVDEVRQFIGELYQVGHVARVPVTHMATAAGVRRETVHYWLRNTTDERSAA